MIPKTAVFGGLFNRRSTRRFWGPLVTPGTILMGPKGSNWSSHMWDTMFNPVQPVFNPNRAARPVYGQILPNMAKNGCFLAIILFPVTETWTSRLNIQKLDPIDQNKPLVFSEKKRFFWPPLPLTHCALIFCSGHKMRNFPRMLVDGMNVNMKVLSWDLCHWDFEG